VDEIVDGEESPQKEENKESNHSNPLDCKSVSTTSFDNWKKQNKIFSKHTFNNLDDD